ncbi:MAG: ISAs1 family transposase [Daejeonella sp.]
MNKRSKILSYFSTMEDHRLDRKKKHDMLDIIAITIAAVLCGADDWYDIEDFAEIQEPWLKTFLTLENGIPSHDTFNRFFAKLDPRSFESCFADWVSSLEGITKEQLISIDGKTIRGAKENGKKSPVHIVSAWSSENEITLGQLRVYEKSNEITAIPALLGSIFLENCLVSIDAMGCQHTIVDAILDKDCEYLLAVKENQKELHQNLLDSFRFFKPDDIFTDIDTGHGRVETRKCTVIKDLGHISRETEWRKLTSLIRIESERFIKVSGKTETQTRYYISSSNETAGYFQKNIRSHWGIENKLHWMLDVVFNEDKSRKRAGNAAQNFSLVTKIALRLLKNDQSSKRSVKTRRKRAGWNRDYLIKILNF